MDLSVFAVVHSGSPAPGDLHGALPLASKRYCSPNNNVVASKERELPANEAERKRLP